MTAGRAAVVSGEVPADGPGDGPAGGSVDHA